MADQFLLKVITLSGTAVEAQATSVVLPTAVGEIDVLPGHVDYNGILGVGVLYYTLAETGETKRLVVSGGLIQFAKEVLIVLADDVDLPDSIGRVHFANERNELSRIVDSGDTTSSEWLVARAKLSRIEAVESLFAH